MPAHSSFRIQRWVLLTHLAVTILVLGCGPLGALSRTNPGSGPGGAPSVPLGQLPPGDLRGIAVQWALAQQGKPYTQYPAGAITCGRGSARCQRWGPDCFDCSGLTMKAYEAAGIQIGWNTREQVHDGVAVLCTPAHLNGTATTCWQPGDLAVWVDGGTPHHVAMYAGNGTFVEALNCGQPVLHWARPARTFPQIAVRRIVDVDGRTLLGGG